MIRLIIILLTIRNFSVIGLRPTPLTTPPQDALSTLSDQIETLSSQLDKFNSYYLNTLDQRVTLILTAATSIDSNIKSLHEKAQVWEIFRHHIDSWTDHMKSVDHKIDLMKRSQEDCQSIENKLNSLEYAINHILNRIQSGDSRGSGQNSSVIENKLAEIYNTLHEQIRSNNFDKKEIMLKLNNVKKHIINLKMDLAINPQKTSKNTRYDGEDDDRINDSLDDLHVKMDQILNSVSPSKLSQFFSSNNRDQYSNSNELLHIARNIDRRTTRLYDHSIQSDSEIISCCRLTSNELATFTGSADLLLKRIEKLLTIVQNRVHVTRGQKSRNRNKEIDLTKESTFDEGELITKNEDEIFPHRYDNSTVSVRESFYSTNGDEHDESSGDTEDFPVNKRSDWTGCHDVHTRRDGIYLFATKRTDGMNINPAGRDFNRRFCSFPTDGLGWTVIQNRGAYKTQENFNRSWTEYKYGFGSLKKDFWFGNEFIHRLVHKGNYELRIELEDFDDTQVWAEYSTFKIDSERYNYNLAIDGYRGAVSDSMIYHNNMDFSTFDRINDKTTQSCCPCAPGYGSGWWFNNCSEANLNGIYRRTPYGHNFIGIVWEHWHGDYSLKNTRMLIRPKNQLFKEDDDNDFSSGDTEIPEDP